uniref:DUF7027 domain-containing protein n=1 Tax=Plectus sambesii TaxID=2011161 RepID=A0A914WIN8_9BILA
MSQVQPKFYSNDPKYRCCCGCCHVMTIAKFISFLFTGGTLFYGKEFYEVIQSPAYVRYSNILLACFLIAIAISISLWYGLIEEREGFLLPILFCSAITNFLQCIISIALPVFMIISMIRSLDAELTISLIRSSLLFMMQYWYFRVLKNAYYYIKHKRLSLTGDSTGYLR